MKNEQIKKTSIYIENNGEFLAKWFGSRSEKAFIKHVDTLYFMVTPDIEDYKKSEEWHNYVKMLTEKKEKAETIRENIPVFTDVQPALEVVGYCGAQMYSLHFGLEDSFDVFTCAKVPNAKTPPIQVQIRSQSLWLDGLKGAFDKAYNCIASKVVCQTETYGLD